MIYFLKKVHFDEDVWIDCKISPIHIPVASVIALLHFPAKLLSYLGDHWILSHYIEILILETLMAIFFRFLILSIRSILGLRIYTFSFSYYEQSSLYDSYVFLGINKIIWITHHTFTLFSLK